VLYSSGGGADGVTTAIVRRLLKVAPGESVCDECLAVALKISLGELRAATSALTQSRGFTSAVLGLAQTVAVRRS